MGKKIKEQKRSSKIINVISYVLENGCHACDCSLFQMIKHISMDLYLYVYELASTCPPTTFVSGNICILHEALVDREASVISL